MDVLLFVVGIICLLLSLHFGINGWMEWKYGGWKREEERKHRRTIEWFEEIRKSSKRYLEEHPDAEWLPWSQFEAEADKKVPGGRP